MSSIIADVLAAKKRRRNMLRKLPLSEKIKMIVKMQEIIYPLIKGHNPRACVWKI